MLKWGSSIFLTPAYRRGYVEVLKVLTCTEEEGTQKIPEQVLDFMKKHKDPNYVFEVGDKSKVDSMVSSMSQEGFQVLEMIMRYFWYTEEERKKYDQSIIDHSRKEQIKNQKYIQMRIDNYIKQREENGLPFRGMDPSKLMDYPIGCAQALFVLDTLILNYVNQIPEEYILVMVMARKKEYQYSFELVKYDGMLYEKETLVEETLEILADISYRYWKWYQVSPEDIEVGLNMICYCPLCDQ